MLERLGRRATPTDWRRSVSNGNLEEEDEKGSGSETDYGPCAPISGHLCIAFGGVHTLIDRYTAGQWNAVS